jgi:HEAT repeat protein
VIEREILKIVRAPGDSGERLSAIADEFRRGRDIYELVVLLDSTDAELVSVGAWLLGELPLALYNSDRFVSRLRELVDHANPMVRFHAFGALYPAMDPTHTATHQLLKRLLADSNEGVRRSAQAAAVRLSLN